MTIKNLLERVRSNHKATVNADTDPDVTIVTVVGVVDGRLSDVSDDAVTLAVQAPNADQTAMESVKLTIAVAHIVAVTSGTVTIDKGRFYVGSR